MATTKRSWYVMPTAGHDIHGQSAVCSMPDGKTIALVYDGAAHAGFIATAPEFYEALKRLLTHVIDDNDDYEAVRDADMLVIQAEREGIA